MEKEIIASAYLSPEENLVNAIIQQAAIDYLGAAKDMNGHGGAKDWRERSPASWTVGERKKVKSDCERFFHSGWTWAYVELDSDKIFDALKRQI